MVEQPIAAIIDTFPSLGKTILEQSLTSQEDDNYTIVSYKVFHIGVVNDTPAIGIEAAFDLSQTVAALERSFALSDQMFAQGMVHTSPIAIRFVKKTDALVAMQQGRNTGFMEVIGMRDSKSTVPLLKSYQRTMYQDLGARPHWGLDLNLLTGESQLRGLYPKWDVWKAQYRRFNGGTFDGKVTDRLGISVRAGKLPMAFVFTNNNNERILFDMVIKPAESAAGGEAAMDHDAMGHRSAPADAAPEKTADAKK